MGKRIQFGRILITAMVAVIAATVAANATITSLPTSIDFGNVVLNTTSTLPADITVDGGYAVAFASGTGTNAPFSFDFNTCTPFVGPGTCSINESFTPTGVGPISGSLTMTECPLFVGSCTGVSIPLTGNGVSLAAAGSPALDFGLVPIGSTATRDSSITVDTGYEIAFATGLGTNSPWSFDFSTCDAGGVFTGPGTCSIGESFTPTAPGPRSANLTVDECPVGGVGACIGIPISLTGDGLSLAAANPPTLDFGSVPLGTMVSKLSTLTVDAGYTIAFASGSGTNTPWSFDFGSCDAGGAFTGPGTCTISEAFLPTSLGLAAGDLQVSECQIPYGGCIGIPLSLTGTGVTPPPPPPPSVPEPASIALLGFALAGLWRRRTARTRGTHA